MFTITDTNLSNKTTGIPRVLGAAAAAAVLFASGRAAAIDCNDPTLPPPIYGSGGSATKPLLGKVAAKLFAAAQPLNVVYQSPGACVGVNALLSSATLTGTASYWDATGKEQTCTIPNPGVPVEFANSGNSATACPGVSAVPTDVGDFLGPANAFTLVVPFASSQTTISAEAAYFVFGFGQLGQAQPWVDDSQIYRRDANSAAQLFIALNTGVPAEKFKGIDTKTNSGTANAVAQSPKPEAAIGLISGEVADANRATLKILAFQAKGQRCGYLPDSTATSFDKKNVRNGQYPIWAPLHFYAKVGTDKKASNPNVARFVSLFDSDVAPPPDLDILETEIRAGTIPKCAMNVWRETDIGAVSKHTPLEPCGCFFESVATGKTSCTACTTSDQCGGAAPTCRHGFCEAR